VDYSAPAQLTSSASRHKMVQLDEALLEGMVLSELKILGIAAATVAIQTTPKIATAAVQTGDTWGELTAIGTWVLAVAASATLWYQVRLATRALNASAFADFARRWDSPEMRKRRRDLSQELKTKGPIPADKIDDVVDFFEELGVAFRARNLSKAQIFNGFSTGARNYWMACGKTYSERLRAQYGDPKSHTA
jgi:hypothetical protein